MRISKKCKSKPNPEVNDKATKPLTGAFRLTHKGAIFTIAVSAFILRIIAMLIWGDSLEETVYEYDRIARNIAAGLGFSFDMYGSTPLAPTAWMAPFYPYLLAAYYRLIGDNLLGMALGQALAGGEICWLLGVGGRMLSGKNVGMIAALSFAIYPAMILLPMKFVAETWILLEMTLIFVIGAKYVRDGKRSQIIIVGILCGIAALTRVSALALPLALLFWFWLKREKTRKLLLDSVLLLLVAAAVVAPWTIRNYSVFGEFIPVRTNFWINVWRGNFPDATGTPRNFDKIPHDAALDPRYEAFVESQLVGGEIQHEEVYRRLALQHIKDDPLRYLSLSLRRFFYFWTIDPTHPLTGHPVYWAPWFLLLILAGVGVFSSRDHWSDYSFWYLLFGITTLAYSLTLVLPRYRIPLLPGLMLLAAEGLRALLRLRREPGSV